MVAQEALFDRARTLLRSASRVLVMTGAGMSAESGVPTFRGPGAHWRGKHFSELATPTAFAENPRLIWDWYLYRRTVVANCAPNAGHIALAEWARTHKDVVLITQNVDGLHERAGHPDVLRFHGSLWYNRCTSCGKEREDHSLVYPSLPRSPCCDAPERPAIVWFGEAIPSCVHLNVLVKLVDAQVLMVIGTSGRVQPATSLVTVARVFSITVVHVDIVVPDTQEFETDVVLQESSAQLLPRLFSY